jgi:hypothetical protein
MMGLIDRDYKRDRKPADIDFRPPRRRPWPSWAIALVFCAALAGLYRVTDMYMEHRAAQDDARRRAKAAATAPAARAEPPASRRPDSNGSAGASDRPTAHPVTPPTTRSATVRTVTKCVDARGRTAYSDGPCGAGERTSRVEVRSDVNVADAERIPPPSPSAAPAHINTATAPTGAPQSYAEDPRAVCAALEQSIAAYDAQARQPQSGQMQDWISARRKEARDRQFKLRC